MKFCDKCNGDKNCSRCERILKLLDHLQDSEETMHGADSHAGDQDDTVTLMPRMYHHPSFVELRATIDRLLSHDRAAWAHLLGFYRSEWRVVSRPVRRKNVKGKTITEPARVRERVVNRWVEVPVKDRGVRFVVTSFRGEPFLPDELLEGIAA